jgi:2-phosphosulfolactate phosphatase
MRVNVLSGNIDSSIIQSDVVVAIDVLRSSTTILTALANGAERVIPVSIFEEALKMSGRNNVLLGGEMNGVKPAFFHLGNSPLEYIRERVEGKSIILYTSSGTRLLRFLGAVSKRVFIGAVVNYSILTKHILENGFKHVSIITAGRVGAPALEDIYCAGLIIKSLPCSELNSEGEVAREIAGLSIDVIKEARHAVELKKLGFKKDVDYCLTPDGVSIVATLDQTNGCIRLPSQHFS